MLYVRNISRHFTMELLLGALSGIILIGLTQVANAEGRGGEHRQYTDSRHGHNHSYPARGHYVERLPHGYRTVVYGRSHYYFYGGVWYRPYGARFIVVAPPFGLVVPVLPPYYTTIWAGGVPYYYANEAYYAQTEGGYMVVEPPPGIAQAAPSAGPTSSDQMFIYPRQDQSQQQQSKDRYECHSWAVNQTHYDPTQPPGGVPPAQMNQKRTDYQRAMGACLDGRGYTVK